CSLTDSLAVLLRAFPSPFFPSTPLFRSWFCFSMLLFPLGAAHRESQSPPLLQFNPGAAGQSLPGGASAIPRPGSPTQTETSPGRSEEHTSELQSRYDTVCRLLLEKKKML